LPKSRSGWITLVAVLYLISGALNLLAGLVALGLKLSGSDALDNVYLGDWPADDLEGVAIMMVIFGVLQLVLGTGLWRRSRWAWIAGLVVSSLVIVTHIFFHRVLDAWAVGGLVTNVIILWILVVKEDDFVEARPVEP
jgi:lysylphosphatidylglycerol synthetase-like protein (DUF2156 family)